MFPWMVICRLWIRTRAALNHCILVCRMSCSPQTRMNVEEMAHGGAGRTHNHPNISSPPPPPQCFGFPPPPPSGGIPPRHHGSECLQSLTGRECVKTCVCPALLAWVMPGPAGSTGHRAQPGTKSTDCCIVLYEYLYINVSYRVGWDNKRTWIAVKILSILCKFEYVNMRSFTWH